MLSVCSTFSNDYVARVTVLIGVSVTESNDFCVYTRVRESTDVLDAAHMLLNAIRMSTNCCMSIPKIAHYTGPSSSHLLEHLGNTTKAAI
jgi:hypothetical protein